MKQSSFRPRFRAVCRGSLLACALGLGLCAPLPSRAAEAAKGAQPSLNREFSKPDLDVSQWVERFEREGREVYDQRERIVQAAGIEPGMVVADVGAGTGLFEPLFAKAVGPRGKVIAVDIAPKFLEHIRREADRLELRNIQTVLCTERSANLPEASVDLVFICDTYHHFEHPAATLASIHRALKPGGVLVLVEFRREPGKSSQWLLKHVRAGREVFTREIEAAGFEAIATEDFLQQNYMARFRKR